MQTSLSSQPMAPRKEYETANVDGREVHVVSPKHFYSAEVPHMGLGLFANVDLDPGDIWWANSLSDPRFVERMIPWESHTNRPVETRKEDEIKCYFDGASRSLVICSEPFCRVNHGIVGRNANSDTDQLGNSIISCHVPAGEQILIPYDYESVISIVWKFPEFAARVPPEMLSNDSFLFQSVIDCALARDFLKSL